MSTARVRLCHPVHPEQIPGPPETTIWHISAKRDCETAKSMQTVLTIEPFQQHFIRVMVSRVPKRNNKIARAPLRGREELGKKRGRKGSKYMRRLPRASAVRHSPASCCCCLPVPSEAPLSPLPTSPQQIDCLPLARQDRTQVRIPLGAPLVGLLFCWEVYVAFHGKARSPARPCLSVCLC